MVRYPFFLPRRAKGDNQHLGPRGPYAAYEVVPVEAPAPATKSAFGADNRKLRVMHGDGAGRLAGYAGFAAVQKNPASPLFRSREHAFKQFRTGHPADAATGKPPGGEDGSDAIGWRKVGPSKNGTKGFVMAGGHDKFCVRRDHKVGLWGRQETIEGAREDVVGYVVERDAEDVGAHGTLRMVW